jgi:hypothetical protein
MIFIFLVRILHRARPIESGPLAHAGSPLTIHTTLVQHQGLDILWTSCGQSLDKIAHRASGVGWMGEAVFVPLAVGGGNGGPPLDKARILVPLA